MAAPDALRILNLEDNPNDSELIRAELENEWAGVELLRVDTRDAFVRALDEFAPDMVLADYNLPDINGREALAIVRQHHPDIPLVMVTGALGDIEAVELVKLGARDYVMKDHLQRLVSAVQGALSMERGIRSRKAAEHALKDSESRYRTLVETSRDIIWETDPDQRYLFISPRVKDILGYEPEELIGKCAYDLMPPEEARRIEALVASLGPATSYANVENVNLHKDGHAVVLETSAIRIVDQDGNTLAFRGMDHDISERKQADAKILRLNQMYAVLSECNKAIVHSTSEAELFERICENSVRLGDFRMAWIGRIDPATHMLVPVARAGEGADEYLRDIKISQDADSEYGRGPTGTSLREDRPFWCQDFLASELTGPWRDQAAALGWRSSASLPLHCDGEIVGAFILYAGTVNAFDPEVCELLLEMSADIDYSLDYYRHETERQQAERALAESHSLLKSVISTSPVRIFWKDRESRYLGCNPIFAQDAGATSPEEVIGKDDFQLGWKAQAEQYRADDRMVMESGIPKLSYDELQDSPDGEVIWLRTSKLPLRNAVNEIIGVLGMYEDITERKRVELALQRSEADLNLAQAVAQIGSWKLDIASNRLSWSDEAYRIFGTPKGEVVGLDDFIATLHPDDRERAVRAWNDAVAGAPYDIEHRIVVNGEIRWVRERAIIERDAAGRALFGVGTTQDITERKQAEEALRKLSLAVEQSPSSVVITDLDARLEYVNEAFVRATGYTREEAIGQNPRILHSGKNPRETYDDMWAHLTRGDTWKGELVNRRKDGSEYVEAILISPVRDAGGRTTHYLAIKEDITERKRVEQALLESEQKFRVMTASAQDAIVMIDHDGNVSFWNAAAEKIFGYSEQEIIGRDLHQWLTPPRYREAYAAGFSHFRETGEGEVVGKTRELAALHKDGHELPVELSLSAVNIAGEWQAIGIMRDITGRKQDEARAAAHYERIAAINAQLLESNKQLEHAKSQLLQSEKMAAIGVLAAGVAHEINNPVGYVNSNLGTLDKYLADIFVILDKYEAAEALEQDGNPLLDELRQYKARADFSFLREDIRSLISESHQGLERIKKIILDLKDFSRSDVEEKWVWADVHHGLDTTLNVVWNELKYKCEVVKEYGELPDIYCLPSQLNQVFMNLLVNAAQAIEVRGKITIRTGAEGEQVWVEVGDSGQGIPAENIPRLFDPFFTTKPVGQGTGLGLSVSYKIVEKHHGKIEVHSEVGKGTTFRIWLPVRPPVGKNGSI